VGKTSLTVRFCKGNFDGEQVSTIDASCLSQTIQVGGSTGGKVTLNIWDTAGQERYHALNKVYYQGAEGEKEGMIYSSVGALIVYDITDLESWAKVNIWVKELQRFLPAETPIIITGNKCDIPNRQIPLDEAER
jgi:Ras-related protein Rab-21